MAKLKGSKDHVAEKAKAEASSPREVISHPQSHPKNDVLPQLLPTLAVMHQTHQQIL